MHERECKGYISFNRGVNELNRGVNELNRGVNELNRGVNHSVARQGCNLLRAAVTSAVTSQGCCCGNLQIHPLDLGHSVQFYFFFNDIQPSAIDIAFLSSVPIFNKPSILTYSFNTAIICFFSIECFIWNKPREHITILFGGFTYAGHRPSFRYMQIMLFS